MQEVEVDVEDDRDLGLLADRGNGFQDFWRSCSRLQAPLRSQLIHNAVGERIAERNAQFQYVHPGPIKFHGQSVGGLEIRIPSSNVDDQSLASGGLQRGKSLFNAVHVPAVSA